ncbi:hypothetical protein [Allokutzneria oryzae]|uniref:DUF2993 domain-containing protein n=1 Tax=Allokutzneria oryzae TaxID=1378989 RepID=A0ABV6AAN6_9PSEU
MRPRGLTRLTVLLLVATTVPGHAEPAPGCAPDRLPKAVPEQGSAEERLAADILAACLTQSPAPQARSRPAANRLRASSVTAKSVTPALGVTVSMDATSLKIVDATLVTAGGRTEFRVADAELGTVELQATSLSGKLFGLIPITLGGGLPVPPLPLPYVKLTDVTVDGVTVTARTAALREVTGD